jgi:hypothetical protein
MSINSTIIAPDLDQVLLQDVSVSNRVLGDPLDSVPSSRHGQDLVDDRLDVLLRAEVEHLEHLLLGTCERDEFIVRPSIDLALEREVKEMDVKKPAYPSANHRKRPSFQRRRTRRSRRAGQGVRP